ncbi:MAG: hypothetical protein EP349_03085 [Alphaproteobacteria bacterium]|nr:MAG: hypothetical protein EP349_03085 [Alphaproteobacteria bacterium]
MEQHQEKSKIRYLGNRTESDPILVFHMHMRDMTGSGEREMRMRKSQIARYYSGTEQISVMETAEKEKIYVALPFQELCNIMEGRVPLGRGQQIDLTEVTGKKVTEMLTSKKLSLLFNTAAFDDVLGKDDLLVFMDGYSDSSGGRNEKIAFLASDVTKYDDGFLRLRDWDSFKGEWNMSGLSYGPYIRTGSKRLAEAVRKAKQDGLHVLDLTAQDAAAPHPEQIKFSTASATLRR